MHGLVILNAKCEVIRPALIWCDQRSQAQVDAIISRLDKTSNSKLASVSWGKSLFNTAGVSDIQGDAGSMKNRAKIFALASTGAVEGMYDAAHFILEAGGKAIGIAGAYVGSAVSEGRLDSSVGKMVVQDVSDMFKLVTLENAEKVLAMLPKALEKFANASPDEQASGFGEFFGGFLVAGGVGVKLASKGAHSARVGARALRMANHKGISNAAPLAFAGAAHVVGGSGLAVVGGAVP